jgi:predicted RNase H-like nuclease (RuvC/YqgF family)
VFASTFEQILIGDLFAIWSPSMRKNSVFWNVISAALNQADPAIIVKLQKSHIREEQFEQTEVPVIEIASQAVKVGMFWR